MSRRQELCREFQRGSCRFGARCKFLHQIPEQRQQQNNAFAFGQSQQKGSTGRGGNNNYYSSLSGLGNTSRQQSSQSQSQQVKEHKCTDARLCKEQIKEDFQNEKPVFWNLTCYAHWKYLPNDISGDLSFEELRSISYDGAKCGSSLRDVVAKEAALFANKNAEFGNLLKQPYKRPTLTNSTFNNIGNSSNSGFQPQGTKIVFGKPFPSSASPTSSMFGASSGGFQVNGDSKGSFGKGASSPSFGFGTQSSATTFSFGTQSAAQSTFKSSDAFSPSLSFGQTTAGLDQRFNVGGGGTSIPFGNSVFSMANSPFASNGPSQSPFRNNAVFPPANNLGGGSDGQLLEEMSVESPTCMAKNSGISQFIAASSPIKSSNQTSLAIGLMGEPPREPTSTSSDTWAKGSWMLGEIPEEEPPLNAR